MECLHTRYKPNTHLPVWKAVNILINGAVLMSALQVFGVGVPNPYRLRPFIGARVPVNSSFSPLINIHNPFSEPLQVTWTGCRCWRETAHTHDRFVFLCLDVAPGCWDVLQWWGSASGASHRPTGRHCKVMGESVLLMCLYHVSSWGGWND